MLHYGNVLPTTKACITSILKKEKGKYQIVLVNNNTETLTKDVFSDNKNITIINNGKNMGFAAGANVGIRYALSKKADYIILLNNDTILENPIIQKFIQFLQSEKHAGIVGPAITFLYQGKQIYDLGGRVNTLWGRTSHDEVIEIIHSSPRKVTYVSGCCMMIKSEVFQKTGLLDENFFLYYEDVDFCLRAKEKGYASYVLPSVILHHELSKTIGKITPLAVYNQTKSGLLFGKKYCKKTIVFNFLFLFAQSVLFFIKSPKIGIVAFKAMRDTCITLLYATK